MARRLLPFCSKVAKVILKFLCRYFIIGNYLKQCRATGRLGCKEKLHPPLKFFFILYPIVWDVEIGSNACSFQLVVRFNVWLQFGVTDWAVNDSEDVAAAIVNDNNAEVTGKVGVPEGIAVVEETNVTRNQHYRPLVVVCKACCCRAASVNTTDTPIGIEAE